MLLFLYDWLLVVLRISRVGHFWVTGQRGRCRAGTKGEGGAQDAR